MMRDEADWYDVLAAVELPAGDTIADLAEAVTVYLRKFDGTSLNAERRDQLRRLCNYWGVSELWFERWRKTFVTLALTGNGERLLGWLQQPAHPNAASAAS